MKVDIYQTSPHCELKSNSCYEKGVIPLEHDDKLLFEHSALLTTQVCSNQDNWTGVTSFRQKEKTKLPIQYIIDTIKLNHKSIDVLLYSPVYRNGINTLDLWKQVKNENSDLYRAARLLNEAKVLPFNLFEKKWEYSLCNYWVARNDIFYKYTSEVLKPATVFILSESIFERFSFKYRDKVYPIHPFLLEGLFGSFLANNDYIYADINENYYLASQLGYKISKVNFLTVKTIN